MARYPGAEWRPLASNWASQPKMVRYDLVILHTMVGTLAGTDGMFRADGYGGVESHFGVGGDGTVYQWQDTLYRAEANGTANSRAISIETADIGGPFAKWDTKDGNAVPAWTAAQLDALARICAWASTAHAIPLVPVTDSKSTRRGIAYHRLGVPGYAVAGGELWSSARGKVCPGARRIAQVPTIIDRATAIRGGSAPLPPEDLMFNDIPLYLASDGSFRATQLVDSGTKLAGDAYVMLGSTWGDTQFEVTALAADGTPLIQWRPAVKNNHRWDQQLPPTTRLVTVTGRGQYPPSTTDRGTTPAAALGMTAPR